MNTAPILPEPSQAGEQTQRLRRTPQQQLALAELKVERAKTQIKKENDKLHAVRVRRAGEFLLRMAGHDDTANDLIERMKQQLKAAADRKAFGLPPLPNAKVGTPVTAIPPIVEAEQLSSQITASLRRFATMPEGDEKASAKASLLALINDWELATGRLHPNRPKDWEAKPGSRRRIAMAPIKR